MSVRAFLIPENPVSAYELLYVLLDFGEEGPDGGTRTDGGLDPDDGGVGLLSARAPPSLRFVSSNVFEQLTVDC